MDSLVVLLAFVSAITQVAALPTTPCKFNPRNNGFPATCPGDAPYDIIESTLYRNIYCVGGVESVQNPFLLVPGTGTTGSQSFGSGYVKLLGKDGGLGYDVCYVSPPREMMDDAQNNAEYVAYAMGYLYSKTGKPLPVLGWSQGNLVTQWALTFWPSIRAKTTSFISLAGDFKGTTEGPLVSAVELGLDSAAVKQQTEPGSMFLANLAAKGGLYNWVPTTSIYGLTDDVIQPEPGPNDPSATSFMSGRKSGNIFIQQFCPLLLVEHQDHIYINFDYQVVKMALSSSTKYASPTAVAAANLPCTLDPAPGLTAADVLTCEDAITIGLANIANPEYYASAEPAPKAYIATFPNVSAHN